MFAFVRGLSALPWDSHHQRRDNCATHLKAQEIRARSLLKHLAAHTEATPPPPSYKKKRISATLPPIVVPHHSPATAKREPLPPPLPQSLQQRREAFGKAEHARAKSKKNQGKKHGKSTHSLAVHDPPNSQALLMAMHRSPTRGEEAHYEGGVPGLGRIVTFRALPPPMMNRLASPPLPTIPGTDRSGGGKITHRKADPASGSRKHKRGIISRTLPQSSRFTRVPLGSWLSIDVQQWALSLPLSQNYSASLSLHHLLGEELHGLAERDWRRIGIEVEADLQLVWRAVRLHPAPRLRETLSYQAKIVQLYARGMLSVWCVGMGKRDVGGSRSESSV